MAITIATLEPGLKAIHPHSQRLGREDLRQIANRAGPDDEGGWPRGYVLDLERVSESDVSAMDMFWALQKIQERFKSAPYRRLHVWVVAPETSFAFADARMLLGVAASFPKVKMCIVARLDEALACQHGVCPHGISA